MKQANEQIAGGPNRMSTETLSPNEGGRRRTRLLIQIVLAVAVVVAIYAFALTRVAEFGDVWAWIREMTWLEVTTLALLGAWNIATYWILEVASFPGLNYWRAS